ncbi:MAG TPA: HAD family hydrolase [Desulfobacterales bacterium]|nr:HAD family hydrolase [Desulfobacterales bacterium]HIP39284.1 HAD family hydrolase [Desulfocapsa sulfexigens]
MERNIEAVTFDLWDTVFIDDSDEPKRAQKGLLSKYLTRRELVLEFLEKHDSIDKKLVDSSYAATDAAFRKVWYDHNVTWSVAERLEIVLKGLDRTLPPEEMAELVRLHEEMELEIPPDLAPGIVGAIKGLHGKYKLGVISDTIFSSGRVLRQILKSYDLEQYFDVFIFSDQAGFSKPDSRVFVAAADGLGVDVTKIAHIGDRDAKDIQGPQGLGAKGIYTTVVNDRGSNKTSADAICRDYANLVAIVDSL